MVAYARKEELIQTTTAFETSETSPMLTLHLGRDQVITALQISGQQPNQVQSPVSNDAIRHSVQADH